MQNDVASWIHIDLKLAIGRGSQRKKESSRQVSWRQRELAYISEPLAVWRCGREALIWRHRRNILSMLPVTVDSPRLKSAGRAPETAELLPYEKHDKSLQCLGQFFVSFQFFKLRTKINDMTCVHAWWFFPEQQKQKHKHSFLNSNYAKPFPTGSQSDPINQDRQPARVQRYA